MEFDEALAYAADLDVKMVPYENARGMKTMAQTVEAVRPGMSAGLMIGPEGGFEENEITAACVAGFVPVSLGKRILRTETAGLTALSILMYHLELSGEAAAMVSRIDAAGELLPRGEMSAMGKEPKPHDTEDITD